MGTAEAARLYHRFIQTLAGMAVRSHVKHGESVSDLLARDGRRFRGLSSVLVWVLPIVGALAIGHAVPERATAWMGEFDWLAGTALYFGLLWLAWIARLRWLEPWYDRRFGSTATEEAPEAAATPRWLGLASVVLLYAVACGPMNLAEDLGANFFPAAFMVTFCLFAWMLTYLRIWGLFAAYALGVLVAGPTAFDDPRMDLVWTSCLVLPIVGWLWGHLQLELLRAADQPGPSPQPLGDPA